MNSLHASKFDVTFQFLLLQGNDEQKIPTLKKDTLNLEDEVEAMEEQDDVVLPNLSYNIDKKKKKKDRIQFKVS